jgi:hypothetical protein
MSLTAIIASPVIKAAFELLLPIVHDVLGGGRAADKIVQQIKLKSLEIDGERIAAAQRIIQADQDGSPLQRNWRPIAMFVFMGLLVYQVVIVSIINAIFGAGTIPQDSALIQSIIEVIMWGMSGYIVGRSAEKVARTVTSNRTPQVRAEAPDGARPPQVPDTATIETPPFMERDQ